MDTLFKFLFLLSLAGMVFVYPMYFIDLSAFGKIMARDHPDQVSTAAPDLSESFEILQRVKDGHIGELQLSPEALRAHSSTKRLLNIGICLFMTFLFIVLTNAVITKDLGRA